MSESLAKEQRRHLRKELGELAAAAVEDCRRQVAALDLQHRAVAREVIGLRQVQELEGPRLQTRIDGLGAWCQKNEQQASGLRLDIDNALGVLANRVHHLEMLEADRVARAAARPATVMQWLRVTFLGPR